MGGCSQDVYKRQFESLPYGTRYEINQEAAYDYELITETYTGEITPDLQSAVFENHRNDETKRNIDVYKRQGVCSW